jgi:hypothetical protein
MLLKKIFIMFVSLTQFLSYTKAQNEIINEFEGIIIYYETDTIPQDVFFLPCKVVFIGSFTDFAMSQLKNHNSELIEIYFQGIRWGIPTLGKVFESMAFLQCRRLFPNGNYAKMRLSAGKIFCNATHQVQSEYPPQREKFTFELNGKRFDFIAIDYEREKNGLPVFFEPLYLK